ncbi:MAG: dihydrodipicolinate synthase family protein, partial [Kiritimatiellaeota bacterium]|nr:dihydrodipicolinate synthase family protein [Kiritimatiellota bacterium]
MKKHIPLTGLVAAAHTPFKADGSLNLAIVEQQAAHLLKNKVATVFMGGSTGESHSLTLAERQQLAERWSEVTRGTKLGLVAHVGSNCLADARTLAAQAQHVGAQAIAMLSPSYFKPRNLDALIASCAEVAAAAPETPFYFYDIPSMTGTSFVMADFLAQAPEKIPTLVGLKYTNSNLMDYQLCLHAGDGRFDVPYGCDEWMMAAFALGAKGAVGSSYNFAAPVYQRLLVALAAGDLAA